MNNNSVIKKKIKDKANKIVNDALENIREEVAFQIESHFELFIDKFYADYPSPKRYERTFSTYYASDSYESLSVALTKGENKVGIYISSDNIPGNPYYVPGKYGHRRNGDPVDKEWVFENTFELGRHGYPPYEGKLPMPTSPYTNMRYWFEDFKSNKRLVQNKIKDEALEKAIAKNF